MARPKIEWTEKEFEIFEGLCNVQCTIGEIENILKIDHKTIDRICNEHYGVGFSQAYKKYSDNGKMSLRRAQFRIAETNASMAIWLGKQYLGQRDLPEDSTEIEDTGAFFEEAGLNGD